MNHDISSNAQSSNFISTYFTIEEFNSKFNSDNSCNKVLPSSHSNHSYKQDFNEKNFSLLHINTRSLNKNFDSLELLLTNLTQFPFSIIGITETWLRTTSPPVFNLHNYNMLRADRQCGKGGGVALYIFDKLKTKSRPDLHIEGGEDLFVEVQNHNGKNFIVGVIYRPPNNNLDIFLEKLEEVLIKVTRENKEVYLMGDFNIDLLSTENNNTLKLISILSSYAFSPHIGNPTRISNTSQTLIDNIFSNAIDNNNFTNGVLYYDISDHLPIFTIRSLKTFNKNSERSNYKKKRKESERNITSLNVDLTQEGWDNVLQETDADRAYEIFLQRLLFYYNKNIPLVKPKHLIKNKQPWITKGIGNSIKTRNKLYKKALRSKNEQEICRYRKYRNILTSVIRLSRKLHYSYVLERNKGKTSMLWSTVNDIIGKKQTNCVNTFIIDGQQISDPTRISEEFNTYFTKIGPELARNIKSCESHFSDYLPKTCEKSLFLNPTNLHEVTDTVRSLKRSKSSGFDEISVNLLKKIIHPIALPLTHIFNLSLSTGRCPTSLKIAKVTPVYKKDDSSLITNYRPISLLPSISKILEKLVYKRVFKFLTNNDLLSPKQFGFRKGHSTDHAILQLYDKITHSLSQKEHVIGVFMDLSKAFDTLDHKTLIHKLKSYGIRGLALAWFADYLMNRKQYVFFDSTESKKSIITCGVPQGSILGPLLFIIYMNDIINSSPLLNFVLFADDTNIVYSHKNRNTLNSILNNELNKVSQWFKCNRLSLNISKTNFIHFRNVNSPRVRLNLLIDNMPITEKITTKFLGVTIDSNLNWNEHIKNIHTTVSRNIGVLYRLRNFLTEKSLFILYNSFVLSHIMYCNIVWGNCATTKINSLLLLQKRALRIITNSNYLAHSNPLFHRLKTLKVQDIHSLQTSIFMFKFSHDLLPALFHNTFQRNANIHSYPTRRSNDYHLENPKIILAHKSIKHHGPDVWNSLPDAVKQSCALYSFKSLLKTYLISQYDTDEE